MDLQQLHEVLVTLVERHGSDLHLKAWAPPSIRIDGKLEILLEAGMLSPADTEALARTIMPNQANSAFSEELVADFAYTAPDVGRFRVHAYQQRGHVSLAFRWVRANVGSAEELNLPKDFYLLADEVRGLVLVTGPTGCGKSTTLACMVDHINRSRSCHIVTIEDPVEYLHEDRVARIEQREVGFDTPSFGRAVRDALREDPDVILVGEMRDTETAWAAISAAETGHLVLSSLHTTDATDSINRIVDMFPADQQLQVRASLARALRGTMAQRLLQRSDGKGRIPAVETMVVNGRIRRCILDPLLTGDIAAIVADGESYGMRSFDQSLAGHYAAGSITLDEALANATNPHDLRLHLERGGLAPKVRFESDQRPAGGPVGAGAEWAPAGVGLRAGG